MKCDKSLEIAAYLKGEIPAPGREALRLHFDSCAACSTDLAKFDRVLQALGRIDRVEPSPRFVWRVREAFLRAHPEFLERPAPPAPVSWWRGLQETFDYVPAWALSLAAHVVVLAVGAILFFIPPSPEEKLAELDRQVVRAKPREPGRLPEFRSDVPKGGGGPKRIGHVAPDDSGGDDFTPSSRAPKDAIVSPPPVRDFDPNLAKLDPKLWNSRVPRDRKLLAFFEGRSADSQKEMLRLAYGGEGTEKAVQAALAWLARAQQPDGRWVGPTLRGEDGTEFSYSIGLTGLSLLAFMAEGHAPEGGAYAVTVTKGLEFLMLEQRASGLIGPDRGNYLYNHALGGLALIEAAMMTGREAFATAASAAVNYSVAAQNETGGWGYASRSPNNDTSVGVWQIHLLRLSKLEGNRGVITSLNHAHNRLLLMTDGSGKVGYRQRGHFLNGHLALTAAGMFAHQMSTHTPDEELLARQAAVLLERPPILGVEPADHALNDLYFAYFGSLAMHQYGGDASSKWFSPLRDKLLKTQRKDGSWPADFDRWAGYGGQVYTTVLSTLALETPVRYPRLFE